MFMGILSAASSICALALPDTKKLKLLSTLKQAERFYDSEKTILKSACCPTKVEPTKVNI